MSLLVGAFVVFDGCESKGLIPEHTYQVTAERRVPDSKPVRYEIQLDKVEGWYSSDDFRFSSVL